MLPIGLNMCTPGDQELISLAKKRYNLVSLQGKKAVNHCVESLDAQLLTASPWEHVHLTNVNSPIFPSQKDTDDEVKEHLRQNLHLQDKVSLFFFLNECLPNIQLF